MSNEEYRTKFEKLVEEEGLERAINLFAKLNPELLQPELGVVELSVPTWFRLYVRPSCLFTPFNKQAWESILANIDALDDNSDGWCEALKIFQDKWFLGISEKLRSRVFTNAIRQAQTIKNKKLVIETQRHIDSSLTENLNSSFSKMFEDLMADASSWEDYKYILDHLVEYKGRIEGYDPLYDRALTSLVAYARKEDDLTGSIWQRTIYEYAAGSHKHNRKIVVALLKKVKTIEECEPYMPGSYRAGSGITSLMKAMTLKACKIAKTEDEIVFVVGMMEFYRLCEKYSKEYIALLDKSAKLVPKDIPDAWGHWTWLYSKAREAGSKKHEKLALKKIKELDKLREVIRAKPMLISRLQEWDWLRKYGGGLQLYAEKELTELIESISEDHQPSWEFRVAWEFALDNFTEEYPIRAKARQRLLAML